MASTDIISGDTNGLRTSEVRHAVDDADANGDRGRLRVDVTRAQRQLSVSVLNRYIEFSSSDRRW
ncbi:MAG: hypothetical protein E5299_02131 [Burkholderia gladioli]|nr:MAG: hypothetical protein E5299_02131 [Burkholderia gladioli]